MTFGGWSIEEDVLTHMVEHLPADALVVELGSGAASPRVAEHFRLVSYEHDPAFIVTADPPRWVMHHAPLRDNWYDPRILRGTLPASYDALLIDGPPTGRRRLKMLKHLDIFDWSALIIIDDLHRAEEKVLAAKLAEHVGRELKVMKCRQKSFGTL